MTFHFYNKDEFYVYLLISPLYRNLDISNLQNFQDAKYRNFDISPGQVIQKKSVFYLMHNIETLISAFHKFQDIFQNVSRNCSKKLLKRCSKKTKVAFCNESCSKNTFDKFCLQFNHKMCSCVLLKLSLSFKYSLAPASAATL